MKRILIAILALVLNDTMAQTEKASSKSIAGKFGQQYNQGDYESIFDGFAPNMKEALPLDQTIEFLIKSANDEYLFFAHFKQHSIQVKEGDRVKQGQLLGLCGNSGNSSEPHLHFHVQNAEDMNIATGVKCYFDEIVVNGVIRRDYSPVRGEMIGSR